MDARRMKIGTWWVVGTVVVLLATPARSATPDTEVREAVARLNSLRDQFQISGVMPASKDLEAVEQMLTTAVGVATTRKEWSQVAEALLQLNWAERMQARWDSAIAYAEKAREAARQAKDGAYEARAFLGQAKAELSRKELGPAVKHAEAAAQLAAAGTDVKLRFDTLDNWSQVQVALGQSNAAAETLDRALRLKGLKDDSLFYGYLDRADIYLHIAERCDYQPIYEACIEAVEASRADNRRAIALAHRLGWGGLEKQVQDFNAQLDLRKSMIQSRQRMDTNVASFRAFHPTQASEVLVTDRFTSAATGAIPPAVEQMYRASNELQKRPSGFARSSSARLLYVEGLMRLSQGDHVGALTWFEKAVDVLEQDEHALPDDASRTSFFAEYFDMYVAATLEMLDARRYADAFAMMERSRARAMADLLASRRLDVGGSAETRLYGETVRLDGEIATKQAAMFGLLNGGGSQAAIATVEGELARLRESRRRLLARVAAEAPRLGGLTAARPTTLTALQALAKNDHCEILEYLVTETNVVVWYIGPASVQVKNVFLPRSVLQAAVQGLQSDLSTPDQPFDRKRARELYLQLIEPVKAFIQGSRLLVLPHDALTQIPFEVLEDPADNTPLGARLDVSYAPSATVYAGIRTWSPGGDKKLMIVAHPELEVEGHEGKRVAAVYQPGATLGKDAFVTKRTLRKAVGGFDVVHLSVHGKFNREEPLLSYVGLAPDKVDKDDGHLTAAEMFGLPLARAALVVLSACESGKLEVTRGNEVLGMVRGLLYAGAGALVLSRWKVDATATALWMETFHREARTRGLTEAARLALRAVRSDPHYAHPYYWAAFSLVAR